MPENQQTAKNKDEFGKLLSKDEKLFTIPSLGDLVKGTVLNVSKSEVRLDIEGMTTGVIRAQELYNDLDEYSKLKEGDEAEATILELDNENGEMELSFKVAGEQKTWKKIHQALKERKTLKAKVKEANKGGLILNLFSINAFLPVSQLASEHYPKVTGGDKSKILEKLKKLINQEMSVKIMNVSESDETVVVSEKEAMADMQNEVISNFKEGEIVEGTITAITDFGAFIKIDKKILDDGKELPVKPAEGLIHISEIAWQKIENLKSHLKEGERIKAKIININETKIFLSIKKLLRDPWDDIKKKYTIGQTVEGEVIKINPYGLIVKIDADIQGLAHISELSNKEIKNISDIEKTIKIGSKKEFIIISMDCNNHRIGLSLKEEGKEKSADTDADKEEKNKKKKKIGNKKDEKEKNEIEKK